eukprot:13116026-Ditylum_brightwellii.AAC.1
MENVTSNWEENQVIAPLSSTERNGYGRSKPFQPTFLFVIAITFLSVIALWFLYTAVLYFNEKQKRKQQQMNRDATSVSGENDDFFETEEASVADKKFTFKSPLDIWLTALTKYPGLFLIASLAVPCTLSYLGIEASNRTLDVNVDFATYLAMDSDEFVFGDHFDAAVDFQKETLDEFDDICDVVQNPDQSRRHLARFPQQGEGMNIFYQSPEWTWEKGANVFNAASLYAMKELEERIKEHPGWASNCYQVFAHAKLQCAPFWSVTDRFFDSDGQLKDIDSVLLDMLEEGLVTMTDKYFSVENL